MILTAARKRIGDILFEEGILTEEQLRRALAEQKATGRMLGEILIEQGFVTKEDLLRILSQRLEVKACRLRHGLADPALLNLIGEEEALRLGALPLFKVRGTLTVAMAEPQFLPHIDRLRQLTRCEIHPVLALKSEIVEFIKKYKSSGDVDAFFASLAETDVKVMETGDDDQAGVTDLDRMQEDSPVVNMVNLVLMKAIRDRASDIHIEPDRKGTRIRHRVDGALQDLIKPAPGMHAALISRVKVIGRMDIAEKRLPQEGRVRITAEGREIDLRISSMPTLLGEKIVVRILDQANLKLGLENLGFRPQVLEVVRRMLAQPHGLLLVTGPTGSGKTTTLYTALGHLCSPELNIVTVEDPVEYQLPLVTQIQVQDSIGMTFVRALRSILRQDPDVIMVGEVRDAETARVAVQAALTGHSVLATLHTNDAPGAVARLVDMEIEPYLLSGALNGVIAQRLVRTVCPSCAGPYRPEENVLRDAGLPAQVKAAFTRGAGCDQCRRTGYQGRVGIYEVMEITAELRQVIHRGGSPQELAEVWQRQGGSPLREEGLRLATEGRTTLEEVLAATHSEGGPARAA